jgi:hypothetical protein
LLNANPSFVVRRQVHHRNGVSTIDRRTRHRRFLVQLCRVFDVPNVVVLSQRQTLCNDMHARSINLFLRRFSPGIKSLLVTFTSTFLVMPQFPSLSLTIDVAALRNLFEGGKDELDGDHFDCSGCGASDWFVQTAQKTADCVGQECKNAGVTFAEALNQTMIVVPMPMRRPAPTSASDADSNVTVNAPD